MKLYFSSLEISQLLEEEQKCFSLQEDSIIVVQSTKPAIVLGVSNNPKEYLKENIEIPIYKRQSGGGAVFVDENTILVSFIIKSLPFHFPEEILNWAFSFYKKIFNHSFFSLKDRDFVLGNKKCGGNALYIKRNGWLLHTSFLWDFSPEKMEKYLLMPPKIPTYRNNRTHAEFLCALKDYFSCRENVVRNVFETIDAVLFLSQNEKKMSY